MRRRGQAAKSPDLFRFDSTRFIGRLRDEGAAHPPQVASCLFEVQIRTAFEHAWSVTTHRLTYKGDAVDWRRFRLTAQLKAAVEQIDLLVVGFDEAARHVAEHDWFEVQARTLIVDAFKPLFAEPSIPEENAPKDWTRFSDNLLSLLMASSIAPKARKQKLSFVGQCVDGAVSVIKKTEFELIPRSLSFMQWVFAILTELSLVKPPLQSKYVPPITTELTSLYPAVSSF